MKKLKYRILVRKTANKTYYLVQRKKRWLPSRWKTVDVDESFSRIFNKLGEVLVGKGEYSNDKKFKSFMSNITNSKIYCEGHIIATILN